MEKKEYKFVAQYTCPVLEEVINGYENWLTKQLGGELPAPHVRILGCSEELWKAAYTTLKLTGHTATEKEWDEETNASSAPFLSISGGKLVRLSREAKLRVLPLFLPYLPSEVAQTYADCDAIIFLRMSKVSDRKEQAVICATEATFITSLWTGQPLNLDDDAVAKKLAEYLQQRQQTVTPP